MALASFAPLHHGWLLLLWLFYPLKHSAFAFVSPRATFLFKTPPLSSDTTDTTFSTFSQLTAKRKRQNYDNDDDGQVGEGENWIERAFPVDVDGNDLVDAKKVVDYNLSISGASFQTGSLSKRMYEAIIKANGGSQGMDPDMRRALMLYAMDFTAKEAVKAALLQNGLQLALEDDDMQDEGMWGEMDSIRLLDTDTEEPYGKRYESTEEAIEAWTPGQGFNFVVRQVPAKMRELSLEEILQALDPEGELRDQAQEANWTLPDEELQSLQDLANESVRRTQASPRETAIESEAFAGIEGKRGYRVISRGALSRDSVNADGRENEKTLMHVMDALVSHGALVVDLTDGGTTYKEALYMDEMWRATQDFFQSLDENDTIALGGMTSVLSSSAAAKVGYASYDEGSMQFLETRLERSGDRELMPEDARNVLGSARIASLRRAFDAVCQAGKDVARIVTAASSMEAGAFDGIVEKEQGQEGPSVSGLSFLETDEDDIESSAAVRASQAATLMVDELIDDGKPLDSDELDVSEGDLSMSPHRLCRYFDKHSKTEDATPLPREVFGAHTDSSFITAVPVAAVSGLEVYDEAQEKWYRPELAARRHWQEEQAARGKDPTAFAESIAALDGDDDMVDLPWHSRYVVMMPGEFLQIASRNEVPAAVHRVVSTQNGPPRLSAPILLRGRPGTKFDVSRYLGEMDMALLQECDDMSMEEIHDKTQPSSFQ